MKDIKICQEVKSGMEKNEARLENREFVIAVKVTILNRVSEEPLIVKVILEQSPNRDDGRNHVGVWGETFQAEGALSGKAMKWVHVWHIPGTAEWAL